MARVGVRLAARRAWSRRVACSRAVVGTNRACGPLWMSRDTTTCTETLATLALQRRNSLELKDAPVRSMDCDATPCGFTSGRSEPS